MELFHYWRSSCSWRVRWALNLKGVEYKSTAIDLKIGEQNSTEFLKINPAGLVPAIRVGDQTVGDSIAILEWLEETHPTPALLPVDPWSRLKVRQLTMCIASGTQPLQNLKVQKYFSDEPEARTTYARHWISEGLKVYETLLADSNPGTFSIGSSPTFADLCLIPQVYNANRFGVDMSQFPLISGINERALQTPECDQAAPHNQPGAS